jgi:hypothetical protein
MAASRFARPPDQPRRLPRPGVGKALGTGDFLVCVPVLEKENASRNATSPQDLPFRSCQGLFDQDPLDKERYSFRRGWNCSELFKTQSTARNRFLVKDLRPYNASPAFYIDASDLTSNKK